jgi:hypothetical protein
LARAAEMTEMDATACNDEELAAVEDVAEANIPDDPDADESLAAAPNSCSVCYHCATPFDASNIETTQHYFSCGHAISCGGCAAVGLRTRLLQLQP